MYSYLVFDLNQHQFNKCMCECVSILDKWLSALIFTHATDLHECKAPSPICSRVQMHFEICGSVSWNKISMWEQRQQQQHPNTHTNIQTNNKNKMKWNSRRSV